MWLGISVKAAWDSVTLPWLKTPYFRKASVEAHNSRPTYATTLTIYPSDSSSGKVPQKSQVVQLIQRRMSAFNVRSLLYS